MGVFEVLGGGGVLVHEPLDVELLGAGADLQVVLLVRERVRGLQQRFEVLRLGAGGLLGHEKVGAVFEGREGVGTGLALERRGGGPRVGVDLQSAAVFVDGRRQ